MPFPLRYVTGAGEVATSFDFFTVGTGTGIKELYGVTSTSSGSLLYALSPFALEVGDGTWNATSDKYKRRTALDDTSNNLTVSFALLAFTQAQLIEGEAHVNFTWCKSGTTNANLTIGVAKNDVLLGSTSTSLKTSSGAYTENVKISLPRTTYAVGDVLSVTVTGNNPNIAGQNIFFFHDPQNNNFSGVAPTAITASNNTTRFRAYIPFVID